MPAPFVSYLALIGAILLEVSGSAFLQRSEQFTKPIPTAAMAILYVASFYCLSLALRSLPIGIAYAIWAGLGIVLTACVSATLFKQSLDLPALIGIGFITIGVVIMNVFSQSAAHG